MVTKYRAVATRDGKLITTGASKGKGRWSDGQIYYVPANSDRAHSGYESSFNLLRGELEFERQRHPEWNWRLQRAEWLPKNGLSQWMDVADEDLLQ